MSTATLLEKVLLAHAAAYVAVLALVLLPTPLILFFLRRRHPGATARRAYLLRRPTGWRPPTTSETQRLRDIRVRMLGLILPFSLGLSWPTAALLKAALGVHPSALPAPFLWSVQGLLVLLAWGFLPLAAALATLAREALRHDPALPATHDQPPGPARFWPYTQ